MSEKKAYMRKLNLIVSDTIYDVLTSPLMKRLYSSEDPAEIAVKILEENMKMKIERGDFEHLPGKEEIYKSFDAKPKKTEPV